MTGRRSPGAVARALRDRMDVGGTGYASVSRRRSDGATRRHILQSGDFGYNIRMPVSSNNTDPSRALPLVVELLPAPDPITVFKKLRPLPYCLFLDSALPDETLGRYSFVTADPFGFAEVPADGSDGLGPVQSRLAEMRSDTVTGLPPFQGGVAGLFSYELGRSLEQIPPPGFDDFHVPAMAVGYYDVVVAFDHVDGRAWVISQGFPETKDAARKRRAEARLAFFESLISGQEPVMAGRHSIDLPALRLDELSRCYPVADYPNLFSNFDRAGYDEAVRRAIDYIYAGDIFQVNISQRLLFAAHDDSMSLYLRLRERNPAPFAGFFDLGGYQIVSASPERFLAVREGLVEARPIKGTRQRCCSPEADLFSANELLRSEKDRAENVMIVDLLRNDISRVCVPDSVRVTTLCGLEVYAFVQHLVSVVEGRLAPKRTAVDLIRAAFPGGSITGAPKVRAMEIIAELEPTARGAYCGALGYVGFDGTVDLSILIRTITAGRGWWQIPVGGGIVAQSDPQGEYEETWHKAVGLLRSLAK